MSAMDCNIGLAKTCSIASNKTRELQQSFSKSSSVELSRPGALVVVRQAGQAHKYLWSPMPATLIHTTLDNILRCTVVEPGHLLAFRCPGTALLNLAELAQIAEHAYAIV